MICRKSALFGENYDVFLAKIFATQYIQKTLYNDIIKKKKKRYKCKDSTFILLTAKINSAGK